MSFSTHSLQTITIVYHWNICFHSNDHQHQSSFWTLSKFLSLLFLNYLINCISQWHLLAFIFYIFLSLKKVFNYEIFSHIIKKHENESVVSNTISPLNSIKWLISTVIHWHIKCQIAKRGPIARVIAVSSWLTLVVNSIYDYDVILSPDFSAVHLDIIDLSYSSLHFCCSQ